MNDKLQELQSMGNQGAGGGYYQNQNQYQQQQQQPMQYQAGYQQPMYQQQQPMYQQNQYQQGGMQYQQQQQQPGNYMGYGEENMIQKQNYNVVAQNTQQNDLQDINLEEGNQGEELIPEFTAKVNRTKQILSKIQINNDEIKELKESHQRAINTRVEKDINEDMNNILNENSKLNQQLKNLMEDMARDIEQDKATQPDAAETKFKQNAFNSLATKVQDVLQNSQNAQISFKDGIKNKVTRQVKILDPNITDNEVNEMVDDPQKYADLLQEKTVGAGSIQLRNAISDIQDKCRDIKKLQQNVELVHQMFLDMALLVQQQGQQIDNIELNINTANKNFKQADKNLTKAKQEHKEGRKKACCIIMGGLVVLIIILMPILMSS